MPAQKASPAYKELLPDGKDLSFVEVTVTTI